MFIYSGYWRTWSRLLLNDFNGQYVELDLTPVNALTHTWDAVECETIRCHRTARAPRDKITTQLPPDVRQLMVEKLGAELVSVMLTRDYLAEIDWSLYDKNKVGGGVPFAKCQRVTVS